MNNNTIFVRRSFLLITLAFALLVTGCLHTRTPSVATNAPAPAFTLSDSAGKRVSLAELTAQGPAIVMFYRGYW